MGLPGHRRTSSHKHRRAAHFALKPIFLTVCEKCKAPIASHRACQVCGWYKGRVVIAKAAKRLARMAKHSHAGHAHEAAVVEKKDKAVKKSAPKKVSSSKASTAKRIMQKPQATPQSSGK